MTIPVWHVAGRGYLWRQKDRNQKRRDVEVGSSAKGYMSGWPSLMIAFKLLGTGQKDAPPTPQPQSQWPVTSRL